MVEKVYDILECPVCLQNYNLDTHEPYVLSCGHSFCFKTITQLYVNNQIKCPSCKKILVYRSINEIGKNWITLKILQETLKASGVQDIHDQLLQCNTLIKKIKTQNKQIDKYIEKIVTKGKKAKEYNNQVIWQIKAYQNLVLEQNQPFQNKEKTLKQLERIKHDFEYLRKIFITAENFQSQENLQIKELQAQIKKVQGYEIIMDYSIFKKNVLTFIDNGNWYTSAFKYKIKQKNFERVLSLIEDITANDVDDVSIFSFLHYKGIGVQENQEKAKQILQSKLVDQNGRALLLKYKVNDALQSDLLLKSCYLGYSQSFSQAGYQSQAELQSYEKAKILFAAADQLGSSVGSNNLGLQIYWDQGINWKIKAEIMLRALNKGYYSIGNKQYLDQYYNDNEQFRLKYPNYVKWEKPYEEYSQQEIILL